MSRLDNRSSIEMHQMQVLSGAHAACSIARFFSGLHLSRIRHTTEELLLFQHLSGHACLCVHFGVQLMQNEPEFHLKAHARQLQDLPKQQLPQVSVRNRVTVVAVSRFS